MDALGLSVKIAELATNASIPVKRNFYSTCKTATLMALLLATQFSNGQSIANSNFEAGNSGFTSGYNFSPPDTTSLLLEGNYTVNTDAANNHGLFASFGDHTTGTGKYLIVNGALQSGIQAYANSVSGLTIGNQYQFSLWIANAHSDSPATLSLSVNGTAVALFSATGLGVWQKFTASFIASSPSTSLELTDVNTAYSGNDFAIDDLTIQLVPEPSSIAILSSAFAVLFCYRRR